MSRGKTDFKNVPVSVSLTFEQIKWLKEHPKFNLSQFIQIQLQFLIDTKIVLLELQKEVENEKTVKRR